MENLQRLLLSELGVPVWQLALFVGLISFFMLTYRVRVGLIATYLLVLYWNYYVFREYLYSVASGNFLALIAYVFFGLALAGLSLYTCFYFKESGHLPGFPGFEISRLQGILLKRMEKMESVVLEAEAKTVNEVREFNLLRQEVNDRFLPLEAQLQRIEEASSGRGSIFKELETKQTDQTHGLEDQLREKEDSLKLRDDELRDLKSAVEARVAELRAKLQGVEEDLSRRESGFKEAREKFAARVDDLENQLREGENLREMQLREAERLRAELEARLTGLLSQPQETEEVPGVKDRLSKEMEEKLTARIHELEIELEVKEKLTEALNAEDDDREPKAAEYAFALEALLKAQQESFGRRAASFQEVIESLSDRIHQLERQLKEEESQAGPLEGKGKRKRERNSRPGGGTGEQAKDLQDNIAADLERISAGVGLETESSHFS